jgi:hypothetical protein
MVPSGNSISFYRGVTAWNKAYDGEVINNKMTNRKRNIVFVVSKLANRILVRKVADTVMCR